MIKNEKIKKKIQDYIEEKGFCILAGDSIEKIKLIEDKSVKLMYGSPPYPNAKRNYETWKIENYIQEMDPFIENVIPKLTDDGFIVINVKANRTTPKSSEISSERSLIIEELMLYLKKEKCLYCVDIEIWIKTNPVPTGIRVACQDSYEYNLWFSKSPKWSINTDAIRREYAHSSLKAYENAVFKPRQKNSVQYVTKTKKITPNELGALPFNIVYGAVSSKNINHQAVQPNYLPEKYILACTNKNDLVLDPWVGSGTTGVMAIKNNRKFVGFDVEEKFADLANKNVSEINQMMKRIEDYA